MSLIAAEKDELLKLVFKGSAPDIEPEIVVGQPGHMRGDGLWFALPTPNGGVHYRQCSPRVEHLLRKLLEL